MTILICHNNIIASSGPHDNINYILINILESVWLEGVRVWMEMGMSDFHSNHLIGRSLILISILGWNENGLIYMKFKRCLVRDQNRNRNDLKLESE